MENRTLSVTPNSQDILIAPAPPPRPADAWNGRELGFLKLVGWEATGIFVTQVRFLSPYTNEDDFVPRWVGSHLKHQ